MQAGRHCLRHDGVDCGMYICHGTVYPFFQVGAPLNPKTACQAGREYKLQKP